MGKYPLKFRISTPQVLDGSFVPGLGSTVRVGPWFPVSTVALFAPFLTYLESVSPTFFFVFSGVIRPLRAKKKANNYTI